jgi:hypothetical protein
VAAAPAAQVTQVAHVTQIAARGLAALHTDTDARMGRIVSPARRCLHKNSLLRLLHKALLLVI